MRQIFKPAIEEKIGQDMTLLAKAASLSADGLHLVTALQIWNGEFIHDGRADLKSDNACSDFVKTTTALCPTIDRVALRRGMSRLSVKIDAAMDQRWKGRNDHSDEGSSGMSDGDDGDDGSVPATEKTPAAALPELRADDCDLPAISAKTWLAIERANQQLPHVFRFGNGVARVLTEGKGEGVKIELLDDYDFRYVVARVANWVKEKQDELVPALPPIWLIKDLLAEPRPLLPRLTRLVTAPVFAPNGEILTSPGYHEAARTYYAPAADIEIKTVPDDPSEEEIVAACDLWLELVCDFPFASDADRAHAIAFGLLVFARDLIVGPTPLHLFDKPRPGTGASLLIQALLIPALGGNPAIQTEGRDEDEWRKRLFSTLREGPAMVLIDNVRNKLDSAALSAVLTATHFEDRVLGHSTMQAVPVRAGWAATGNNVTTSSEIVRRIVQSRMDAGLERPAERDPKSFTHPNLLEWASKNRAELIHAALVLIQAWVKAGKPGSDKNLASFEDWTHVMGGILTVAGIPGFLENLDDWRSSAADEDATEWVFVSAWWERFGRVEKAAADLADIAIDAGIDLGQDSQASGKVLGYTLRRLKDCVFTVSSASEKTSGVVKVVRAGVMHGGAAKWRLEERSQQKASPSPPEEHTKKSRPVSLSPSSPSSPSNLKNAVTMVLPSSPSSPPLSPSSPPDGQILNSSGDDGDNGDNETAPEINIAIPPPPPNLVRQPSNNGTVSGPVCSACKTRVLLPHEFVRGTCTVCERKAAGLW